jgi:predicted MFS family arabinose efflux permease
MESISQGDVVPEADAFQPSSTRSRHRWSGQLSSRLGVARDPDFARFWAAESISTIGSQFTAVALPLLAILTMGASPEAVGVLAAAGGLPHLLFGLFAGVWVDRTHRRPLMIAADIGRAVALACIPLASVLGFLSIELLIAVAFVVASGTVIFDTAYLAYVPVLVEKDRLVDANSRLEASASAAQVVGPSLAGTVVRVLGAPGALAIDAVSYVASAAFIWRIRFAEPVPERVAHTSVLEDIRDGLKSVFHNPVLRALSLATGMVNLGGYIFLAVYVLYMTRNLGLGPAAVGLVFAAGGVGALAGSVLANRLSGRLGIGTTLIVSLALFGVFGLTVPLAVLFPRYALPLILAAEFLQWLTLLVFDINAVSLRQAITPHQLLGRVNSCVRFVVLGFQPIGSVLGGVLGERIGLPATLVVGVVVMLVAFVPLIASPVPGLVALPTDQVAMA